MKKNLNEFENESQEILAKENLKTDGIDMFGKELYVGDKVAFAVTGYRNSLSYFEMGRIVKVVAKQSNGVKVDIEVQKVSVNSFVLTPYIKTKFTTSLIKV